MNGAHVGEDAELYALGALEAPERAALEAHAASCDECAARIAQASHAGAALSAALPPYEPPGRLARRIAILEGRRPFAFGRSSWWGALAAAAVLVAAVLGWQDVGLRSDRARTTVALATIVHSHFAHVTMTASSPGAPAAKVLYARDGAWVYIVVDRPISGLHAILWRDGAREDVGVLVPSGGVSTLFLPAARRPRRISLSGPAGLRASATLLYR